MRRRSFLEISGFGVIGGLSGCTMFESSADEDELPTPAERPQIESDDEDDDLDLPPGVTQSGVESSAELAEAHDEQVRPEGFTREDRQTMISYDEQGEVLNWGSTLTVEGVAPEAEYIFGVNRVLGQPYDEEIWAYREYWEDIDAEEIFERIEDRDGEIAYEHLEENPQVEEYLYRANLVTGNQEIEDGFSEDIAVGVNRREDETFTSLSRISRSDDDNLNWQLGIATETGLIERLSGEMWFVESDTLTQMTHQSDFYAIGETVVEPPAWLDEAYESE